MACVTTCWVQVAKGNFKNVSITTCVWGYQCRESPAYLDPVGCPCGPWFGKWGPLTSPEPVSVFREDKQNGQTRNTLKLKLSVSFTHFCFHECQETSLMYRWTTLKSLTGSLDFLHVVGQGESWWRIVKFCLIISTGCIHDVSFLPSS